METAIEFKRIVYLGIIVMAILLLAGCSNAGYGSKSDDLTENDKLAGQTEEPKLSSILKNSTGVNCSVEDQNGSYQISAKDNKLRVEGIDYPNLDDPSGAKVQGSIVSDGKWTYIWSGREGVKFDLDEVKNLSQAENPNTLSDMEMWANAVESSGAKVSCNPGVVSDAAFVAPADVEFKDMSEFIKSAQPSN